MVSSEQNFKNDNTSWLWKKLVFIYLAPINRRVGKLLYIYVIYIALYACPAWWDWWEPNNLYKFDYYYGIRLFGRYYVVFEKKILNIRSIYEYKNKFEKQSPKIVFF